MKKQRFKKAFLSFFYLKLVVLLILFVSKIGCVFRRLTHIPCPTCGMTRAIISIIKLNFPLYFYYNAFALPVLFSVAVLFFSKFFSKLVIVLSIFVLVLNFAYYLYRLSYNAIP